ncbi:hypothetical protein [Burkholderia phage FLC9]|nr:hypothetical protein [Burkholderia phage FLC9]
MDLTNIKEGRDPIPDKKLDTSLNLTSHLQNQEAGSLVTAAILGIDATLRNMRESGLFCKDEIDEMLQSDSKTITVSNDQVILKWVKMGPSASEIRQFTINYALETPDQ